MYKTFEELERLAYMSNLPKIAKLYAQLDDNERDEYEIEKLKSEIDDLHYKCNSEVLNKKVEALENKLEKITDIINE
jgi:predicted RNase H-like nuclease (RuvC/YqgF family)